jgi:hypothetical protein
MPWGKIYGHLLDLHRKRRKIFFLSLAYEGERLEQFLYRNVLIEVTAILWAAQEGMIFYMVKLRQ